MDWTSTRSQLRTPVFQTALVLPGLIVVEIHGATAVVGTSSGRDGAVMSVQQWSSPSLLLVATARSGVNVWDLHTSQSAFSLPASPQQVCVPPSSVQLLAVILLSL